MKALTKLFLASSFICLPHLTQGQFAPPSAGLVAWWRAEGNGNDSSGNGHNGTLLDGSAYDVGKYGLAFSFLGNANHLFVPDSPDLNLTNSLSIAAWIYIKADSWIILNRENSALLGSYALALDDAGHLWFVFNASSGGNAELKAPIAYNQWKHVAATLDGATGDMRLYIDGVMVTNAITSARPIGFDPSQQPAIGIGNTPYPIANGFPFIGLIDEVTLYSRALSPMEVSGMAQLPPPPCVAPPSGLISWWRGESNTVDSVGGNNAVLFNGGTYTTGIVGQALSFSGSNSYAEVPDSSALRLTNEVTIEFWAQRLESGVHWIVNKGGDWTEGGTDYSVDFNDVWSGGPHFAFAFAGGWRGTPVTVDFAWHHYAAVARQGQVNPELYIDGALRPITFNQGVATIALNASTAPLHIGAQIDPVWNYFGKTLVDELSIYGRALSAAEIQSIYNAGAAGKCVTPPIPPSIITQPTNQTVVAGQIALFTVAATGTEPLSYQWKFNGTNIVGATTTSLTLSNVQLAQAGNYIVQVTNAAGSTNSALAVLTVDPQPPYTVPANGLVAWWRGEANGADSSGNGHDATLLNGVAFNTGMFGQAFSFDGNGSTRVLVPESSDFILTNSLSIGAWVYPKANSWVVLIRTDGTLTPYTFQMDDAGHFQFSIKNSAGDMDTVSAPISYNQWHQVTATLDGATGDLRLYMDGAVVAEKTTTLLPLGAINSVYGISIGNTPGAAFPFIGLVDELVLYSRALSPAEVQELVQGTNNCITPPSGLLSWWRGESNTLDTVSGNNGTIVGTVTYAPGVVNQAFVFDGIHRDRVDLGNPPSLQLQNFSIEAWVKRSSATDVSLDDLGADGSISGEGGMILSYGRYGYTFALYNDGRLVLSKVDASGVTVPGPADTNWHHLAVTKSGTNVAFYIDGASAGSVAYDTVFEFSSSISLGSRGDARGGTLFGMIDEPAIYTRALSASEIQAVYAAGSIGKCIVPAAPFIVTQPANQTVTAGGTAGFSAVAGGTPPLAYQWTFNGTNLAGATLSSLTLSNVQRSQAGAYAVTVTNSVASVTSSNANLTVNFPPATVRVSSVTNTSGATLTVPVVLVANGNESALGFSLSFDRNRLSVGSVDLGRDAAGATLFVNTSQTSNGYLGIVLSLPSNQTFPAGNLDLVDVTFTTPIITNKISTTVAFGRSGPVTTQLSDAFGNSLPVNLVSGIITLNPTEFEADVAPRGANDHAVTVTDWIVIGRFAAHLDTPTNALEFQHADCAPRLTLGDGKITVSDWVQAGRYAAGLDPLTPAGGPTNGVFAVARSMLIASGKTGPTPLPASNRQLQVANGSLTQGQEGAVSVNLLALGDENALGFSLSFDAASFAFVSATLGSGADGATLNLNAANAALGQLACVLALPAGATFASGTHQVLTVQLKPVVSASGAYSIALSDLPVSRETSDVEANLLNTTYVNGTVTVSLPLSLGIVLNGTNVTLSWPDTLGDYNLQECSTALTSAAWSNITIEPTTNNARLAVTLPLSNGVRWYRLHHP